MSLDSLSVGGYGQYPDEVVAVRAQPERPGSRISLGVTNPTHRAAAGVLPRAQRSTRLIYFHHQPIGRHQMLHQPHWDELT